ncbi:MAG: caspase family protein [Cyanobacteria bacterium J06626_4]
MAKTALLIGVSNYQRDLSPLPAAIQDVRELKRVLEHPEMGNFDEVATFTDISTQAIREAAERVFSQRKKDDLVLFFFSGHGIKDEYGKLYLAAPETYKDSRGELVRSSAVATSFIQDSMSRSRSKRQIVILDCCFSGAFGDNLAAKDDGVVDIESELGGEGRAILTSSTSSQYSFEQQGADLSIYTRYLVEGIETGTADQDNNGIISTDELHEYVKRKVQAAAPAMKPKIFVGEEGFKISVAHAPAQEPSLQYRREVERVAKNGRGEISAVARSLLKHRQQTLLISDSQAAAIEVEVFEPYRQYQQSLKTYEEALRSALGPHTTITPRQQADLDRFQDILGLQDDDIKAINAKIAAENEAIQFGQQQGALHVKSSASTAANHQAVGDKVVREPERHHPEQRAGEVYTEPTTAADVSAQVSTKHKGAKSKPLSPLFKVTSGLALLTAGGVAIASLKPNAVPSGETAFAFQTASSDHSVVEDSYNQFLKQAVALSQDSLDAFATQTLDIAWEYYERGELEEAIGALNEISPKSSLFQDAQFRIELWTKDWDENQAKLQQAEAALANGELDYARQQANSIKTPMAHWRDVQANIIARIDAATPPPPTPDIESSDNEVGDNTPPPDEVEGMSKEECLNLQTAYDGGDPEAWDKVYSAGSNVEQFCAPHGVYFSG